MSASTQQEQTELQTLAHLLASHVLVAPVYDHDDQRFVTSDAQNLMNAKISKPTNPVGCILLKRTNLVPTLTANLQRAEIVSGFSLVANIMALIMALHTRFSDITAFRGVEAQTLVPLTISTSLIKDEDEAVKHFDYPTEFYADARFHWFENALAGTPNDQLYEVCHRFLAETTVEVKYI